MIVKNEELTLPRCLESLKGFFDEIIIVDTGSADDTKAIAERFGAKVFDFTWIDDFSAARNFSFSKATSDYIFWIDADDVIDQANMKKFRILKERLTPETGKSCYMMYYDTVFDKNGECTFKYYRERMVKRSAGLRWNDAVHETLTYAADREETDIEIRHLKTGEDHTPRNLRILEHMKATRPLSPRESYYLSRELRFAGRFEEALAEALEFLDNPGGWYVNKIAACRDIAVCYRNLGQIEHILPVLFRSFEFGMPAAETCCAVGNEYFEKQRLDEAIFWYRAALLIEPDYGSGAFIESDFYGFIPNIQLCVCYYRKNDRKLAVFHNEEAARFKPDSTAVEHNRKLFSAENFSINA
jgi:glycosyltransferase involved in cell wall biosynthesis